MKRTGQGRDDFWFLSFCSTCGTPSHGYNPVVPKCLLRGETHFVLGKPCSAPNPPRARRLSRSWLQKGKRCCEWFWMQVMNVNELGSLARMVILGRSRMPAFLRMQSKKCERYCVSPAIYHSRCTWNARHAPPNYGMKQTGKGRGCYGHTSFAQNASPPAFVKAMR